MKYIIIGAFDALTECACPIQCVQEMPDEDIVESHRRAVLQGKIPATVGVNLVIYKYGTMDDKTGKIELEDNPVKLCSLGQFYRKTEVKTDACNEIQN